MTTHEDVSLSTRSYSTIDNAADEDAAEWAAFIQQAKNKAPLSQGKREVSGYLRQKRRMEELRLLRGGGSVSRC